jgi:hypothetical protein
MSNVSGSGAVGEVAVSYAERIEKVTTVSDALAEEARGQVRQVVERCRVLATRARELGRLLPLPEDSLMRRELGALVEHLGRRSSRALPAAALGRAALADLAGDVRSRDAALADCDAKLALWGF